MMHVVVGTDTYGRVKAVDKTAIVTLFSMAQMLPIAPIKSYYVWGPAKSEDSGVPFLASVRSIKLRGVPLARVDPCSVAFAYIRAVLAALFGVGFIGTFMGFVFSSNGKPMDDFALSVIRFAEACLALGVVGGVLTYFVPSISRRERAIRTYCGEMLGVSIDPGRVASEVALGIREMVSHLGYTDRANATRSGFVRELVLTRCHVATEDGPDFELQTDKLLDQLRHLDRVAPAQAMNTEPPDAPSAMRKT